MIIQTIRGNKIRIYPTPEQETILLQRMGATRFVYNWALARWGEMHASGEKPTAYGLAKQFRRERPEWFLAMDTEIIDRATSNLGAAFRNFFAKRAKYPTFKRKGEHDSYQVVSRRIKITKAGVSVPKCAPVAMSRPLFHEGPIKANVTFTRQAGRWYVAIPVEVEIPDTAGAEPPVGIDLGLLTFATLSNGERVANPRYYRAAERRMGLSNRRLAAAVEGSSNRLKALQRLQRRQARVANKRKGFLHPLTSDIAKRFSTVAIEDLNTSGMKKSRLAKSVSDAAFREFRRQLEYKMPGRVFVVNRFFPSSKLCSTCGVAKTKLPLSVRSWTCESCGSVHDRDLNAAINLVRAIHPESTPAEIGALGAGQ